jgi:hypothetical protein
MRQRNDELIAALSVCVELGVPAIVWGGPGVGKTSAIRSLAAKLDRHCETVIASIREPADFAGLPVVRPGGVEFSAPSWAHRLIDRGGLLFLDEITTAPPAVQAAMLRVILERTVGDLTLPDTVSIIAAANPPSQAADGWDLAPPLANRFVHLDWVLDAGAWASGTVSGFWGLAEPLRVTVSPAKERRMLGEVAGFIERRRDLLHSVPSTAAEAGRAWPSPRSWTTGGRLLAACESLGSAYGGVGVQLLAGSVGPAAAAEFLAWRSESELPDPERVLADPSSFVLPSRGDRIYASLTSIVAAVAESPTASRWQAAWEAIAIASQAGHTDIAVAVVRSLLSLRPDGAAPPTATLVTMAPVLKEAGLFDALR